ncbi:MAG: pyruvate dehydrogenase (acetyl-transferring) E1 component subunit alpha [Candidatus Kapabacteria bacterium]|nr:pyruvate dehydrogenase (acetyl-transferring) E1 component subunit alpha [Candidatus Kapabacteria bacterium]
MVDRFIMDAATAKGLLHQMLRIRRFEDASAEQYSRGNIRGFLHLYSGEEAIAAGVMQALRHDDIILSSYREHGHALARGIAPSVIMAEMFGMADGCCRGRGGSMHLFDVATNFYGGTAIVASHLPMAVGMALAIRKRDEHRIVCCFFGDGAAAEGTFAESLNLAALWSVPVLFVCENNQYAMGTALQYSHAEKDIAQKGRAYGIESVHVDGMDLLAVIDAMRHAEAVVRTARKPMLLVCNTYRFRAHSMFDAELYRSKDEVVQWKRRDPIDVFTTWATGCGLLTEDAVAQIETTVANEITEAVTMASQGDLEPVEDLERHIYATE